MDTELGRAGSVSNVRAQSSDAGPLAWPRRSRRNAGDHGYWLSFHTEHYRQQLVDSACDLGSRQPEGATSVAFQTPIATIDLVIAERADSAALLLVPLNERVDRLAPTPVTGHEKPPLASDFVVESFNVDRHTYAIGDSFQFELSYRRLLLSVFGLGQWKSASLIDRGHCDASQPVMRLS